MEERKKTHEGASITIGNVSGGIIGSAIGTNAKVEEWEGSNLGNQNTNSGNISIQEIQKQKDEIVSSVDEIYKQLDGDCDVPEGDKNIAKSFLDEIKEIFKEKVSSIKKAVVNGLVKKAEGFKSFAEKAYTFAKSAFNSLFNKLSGFASLLPI